MNLQLFNPLVYKNTLKIPMFGTAHSDVAKSIPPFSFLKSLIFIC